MSAQVANRVRSEAVPSMSETSRVPWVDYAKGICIIMVVMMHTTNQVQEMAGQVGFMEYAVAFARPFRMPDFFLLSGLFLGVVIGRDWQTYTDRKVVHFAYFYTLWVAITCAIKAPAWIFKGTWEKFAEFPIAFVQPLGTLWFIYLLPIFFVVTKLLYERKVKMVLVWFLAAALETAQIQTGWTVIDEFSARWVYFLTGYLFAAHAFTLAKWAAENTAQSLGLLVTWSLINGFLVFGPNPLSSEQPMAALPFVSLFLGLAGAYAVVVCGSLLERFDVLRFVRYCGANSIVIYLAFFLTLTPLRYVVVRYGLNVGWSTLAIMVISIIFPLLLERLVRGTRFGFLFVRPLWCHLRGMKPKSRVTVAPLEQATSGPT